MSKRTELMMPNYHADDLGNAIYHNCTGVLTPLNLNIQKITSDFEAPSPRRIGGIGIDEIRQCQFPSIQSRFSKRTLRGYDSCMSETLQRDLAEPIYLSPLIESSPMQIGSGLGNMFFRQHADLSILEAASSVAITAIPRFYSAR